MRIGISFEDYIDIATSLEQEELKKIITEIGHYNDEIYVITKQSSVDNSTIAKNNRRNIVRVLSKTGIKYDSIVFCSDNNVHDILDRNEIDVYITKNSMQQITLANNDDLARTDNTDISVKLDNIREILNRKTKNDKITGLPSKDRVFDQYYTAKEKTYDIPKMSMYQYIYRKNMDHLDGIALKYQGNEVSYRELFNRIDNCAKALLANGISKGSVATISMPNTPETIVLYYAINKIGAIAHMLDPRLPAEEIKTRVNQMNSETLFFLDADPLTKALGEFDFINETTLKRAVSISPKVSMPTILKVLYTLLLERKSTHIPENESVTNWNCFIESGKKYNEEVPDIYIPNESVVIIHTGGTTGTPKGAVHSNENFNAIASKYRGTRNHARQTEVLSMAPMFHILGIGASIHVALSNGLIADLMPKFTPKIMTNTLKKGKTNHIICITAVLTFLMKNPKIKKMDLSNLGFIISGGDYISPELEKSFNEFLKTVNSPAKLDKGFGLTEGGLAIFSKGEANMYGGIGIPLVNTDIKFVNPETNEEVGYNEKGEMCLHGFVMLRYHNNPEETEIALRTHDDGIKWLHTGDIGHITENGIVCFDDRIKQIIITNGQNVYPSEIEKIIISHTAIQECVVLGIPDEKKGEIPKAYIILKEDIVASETIFNELIDICKKKLAPYAVPYIYKVKTEFPKTLMNKIDKNALIDEENFLSKAPTLYDMRKHN